jgi:hypothetical protein
LSSVTFQATGGPFPSFNQFWLDDVNANVSAVPLPATAWLLASFIAGWLPLRRRKDGAA